jgi:hypothetical protein
LIFCRHPAFPATDNLLPWLATYHRSKTWTGMPVPALLSFFSPTVLQRTTPAAALSTSCGRGPAAGCRGSTDQRVRITPSRRAAIPAREPVTVAPGRLAARTINIRRGGGAARQAPFVREAAPLHLSPRITRYGSDRLGSVAYGPNRQWIWTSPQSGRIQDDWMDPRLKGPNVHTTFDCFLGSMADSSLRFA